MGGHTAFSGPDKGWNGTMTAMSDKSPDLSRNNFLVVVDQTPECRRALRFASRRAARVGGGVVLLHVIEPTTSDGQHWQAVADLMREEAFTAAETLLRQLAVEVRAASGVDCELKIREGRKRDEVLALINEDPSIRILVLGAASDGEGPGPLVTALAGQMSGSMHIPVTVVPGSLSDEQIDELT